MNTLQNSFLALLVGVGDYKHLSNLPSTIRDVHALAATLVDVRYCCYLPENVKKIIGSQATGPIIRSALQELASCSTKYSTVLVYFSGHGGRDRSGNVYLCPHEADSQNIAHTTITGEDFSTLLARIPAHKVVVLLDACHSSGAAFPRSSDTISSLREGLSEEYVQSLAFSEGRVVISSSKANQLSWDRTDGSHGVFTWHLLEGMRGAAATRGDEFVRILNLYDYISREVKDEILRNRYDVQEPILHVKNMDDNFPIAVHQRNPQNSIESSTASKMEEESKDDIREQIVREPLLGAKTLSDYLSTYPQWSSKRTEVDLRRTELERIEKDGRLFGRDDPGYKAARNKAVYSLLEIWQSIEELTL